MKNCIKNDTDNNFSWDSLSLVMPNYVNCEIELLDFFHRVSLHNKAFQKLFIDIEAEEHYVKKYSTFKKSVRKCVFLDSAIFKDLYFEYFEGTDKKQFLRSLARSVNIQMQTFVLTSKSKINFLAFNIFDSKENPQIILRLGMLAKIQPHKSN